MKNKSRGLLFRKYSRELFLFAAIVLMVIIFTLINSTFVSWGNIKDIIDATTIYGLMSLGMSFAIISGGIDLSAGAAMALMGIILAQVATGLVMIIAVSTELLRGKIKLPWAKDRISL